MTAVAEAMWSTVARLDRDELQIEFRRIIRAKLPDMPREQWLELFDIWTDGYVGKCERRCKMVVAESAAQVIPVAPPFRCVCGAETSDSMDAEWMSHHQPHFQGASLERSEEGIERWRYHARPLPPRGPMPVLPPRDFERGHGISRELCHDRTEALAMNGRDILMAARALQIAVESEPPADLTKAKSDIRKLAQMMNQLCDLHDALAARVAKLEQTVGIDGPILLFKPPH